MDFSFEDKFCEHFKALRNCFEAFVIFNIDQCLLNLTGKISILFYYSENLDIEQKRQLYQFPTKCKLSEHGW